MWRVSFKLFADKTDIVLRVANAKFLVIVSPSGWHFEQTTAAQWAADTASAKKLLYFMTSWFSIYPCTCFQFFFCIPSNLKAQPFRCCTLSVCSTVLNTSKESVCLLVQNRPGRIRHSTDVACNEWNNVLSSKECKWGPHYLSMVCAHLECERCDLIRTIRRWCILMMAP